MASAQEDFESREMCLQMNCWVEELSDAQRAFYSKTEKEYNDIMKKVSDMMCRESGAIIEQGSEVLVVQSSSGPSPVSVLSNLVTPVSQAQGGNQGRFLSLTPPPSQPCPPLQAVPKQAAPVNALGQRSVSKSAPGQSTGTFQTPQGTFQLVVDPRLGLIATLPNQQASVNPVIQAGPVTPPTVPQKAVSIQPKPIQSMTNPAEASRKRPSILNRPVLNTSSVSTPSSQAKVSVPDSTTGVIASTNSTVSSQNTSKNKVTSSPASTVHKASTNNRPTENNSIGGLYAGHPLKRNVQDEVRSNASGPDSREVSFNKLAGKTFPSLVVLARPHLRLKDMTPPKLSQERSQLDSKVKCVLMYMATKFTEWLIQQGLIRGDQYCNIHSGSDGPLKLKLGMYSDVTKFPYSGGYVWVSDCCPQRFVSVFNASIFEGAPHPPSILLKLIYHWCCQTNVQNVIQWVKTDNFYVKNFFTHMRSICIAAVHQKHEKLGGPLRKVEVGVISLGTTSQDGNQRQVKVEVLGVMDVDSKLVRLRAVEPLQDGERNYKRRFVKILEPLKQWLHPDSIILTDFTVDKGTLINMGFSQVYQSTIPDPPSATNKTGNQNIMEYLRRIVPRMFQNTLSLLSRQIIQQFLDELVWRERWGPTPAQAFDTIVSHLASQTKLDTGENLLTKLSKIAANPFRCWEYQYWKCDGLLFPEPSLAPSPPPPPPAPASLQTTTTTTTNTASTSGVAWTNAGECIDVECYPSIAITKPYEFKLSGDQEIRLKEALQKIDKGMSVRKAVNIFKLPRSVVMFKAKDILQKTQATSQAPFTDDEEKDIKDHLMTLYDWGFPFGRYDIRFIVKQFLDVCGRTEFSFKDNFPPDMWIERYLSRHPPIRHRLCRNVPSRGNLIEPESVKRYVMSLSSVVHGVPPENILNFMEIGLTGDPLKSMSLELRELRYPVGKRKVKSAASAMLACTALGKVLPSYVIFEGKPLTVTKGHFPGEYYATKSGWFDEIAFEYWLETVVFPWCDEVPGKKVLIGDNLAQIFTVKSLTLCKDKNITFVAMPCNVTGVLSPLDVALCDKLRAQWKTLTRVWASNHSDKFIGLEEFPNHIYELLTTSLGGNIQELIRKAFKVTGLFPYCSKNTSSALENGGVCLEEKEVQEKQGDTKKRKRIFIGADDPPGLKKQAKKPPLIEEVILDDDIEKEVLEMEKALESRADLMPLDPYYYGTKLPVKEFVYSEHKVENLNAKCPHCSTNVADNITLMWHMFVHSKNPTAEVSNMHVCKYCAKILSNQDDLDKHVLEVHKGLESRDNACLICARRMQSRAELILHMHKTHTKRELPYICTICYYRSSEHYKLVDHFYEVHAKGERLQCPCCLKCIAISNMGKKIPANIFFFMHHFEKHFNEARYKCEKCALWFVHKGLMKQHQTKEHSSCLEDVVPYVLDQVMMPPPQIDSHVEPAASTQLPDSAKHSPLGFNKIRMPSLAQSLVCIECKFSFNEKDHYLDLRSCLKCSFATNCEVSMHNHIDVFHSSSLSSASSAGSKVILLSQEMFCMCGFRTRHGNILADHLVKCNKRQAFCSAASANVASRRVAACQLTAIGPSRVSFDESSDPNGELIKAFPSKKRCLDSNGDTAPKKDPSNTFNSLGTFKKNCIEENGERLPETEDEVVKDRPSSRASNSSSSSLKRKRSAKDVELVPVYKDIPTKRNESEVILAVTMPRNTKEIQLGSQLEREHFHESESNSQPRVKS